MAKVTLSGAAQDRIARINKIKVNYTGKSLTLTNLDDLNGETRKLAKMGRTDRWVEAVKRARTLIREGLVSGPNASADNWTEVVNDVTAMLAKAAI